MLRAAFAVLAVLFGPILVKPVERNLEFFFLIVGVLTAWVMGQFGPALIWAALREPWSFTLAVLIFGAGFRLARGRLDQLLAAIIPVLERKLGQPYVEYRRRVRGRILPGLPL
jgi:hypothetical protein